MNSILFSSYRAALARRGHRGARRRVSSLLVVLVAIAAVATREARAQVRVETEAYAGAPFGVARVTIQSGGDFRVNRVPRGGPRAGRIVDMARKLVDPEGDRETTSLASAQMTLVEKSGRALYPVFEKRERPILREFIATPSATTVLFLFQGNAPLDLSVYAPGASATRLVPREDRAAHERLLPAWWADYSAASQGQGVVREYPPMIEEYLTDTLARRLKLPLAKRESQSDSSILQSELNLLFETESARLELTRSILSASGPGPAADLRLPEELPKPQPELLNPPGDVAIEPIAMRVPVECFYVRFGSFPNFLWLRHRMDDWGGELRDVVSERGLNFGLNERFQQQIGLRETALAEVLGPQVIADVAIIGTDTFVREGAAMGMLFQAKNNAALAADLTQQRMLALRGQRLGNQQKLTIAGHSVSLISTPDNALRSFYVADGDFHLVTTSRALVESFLATGAGKHDSLGASPDFGYARGNLPLERNDSVFVFLSPQFFQNLLSPPYRIELARRLRSAVEIELVAIARLAARAEQKDGDTIEQLVAGGLLPAGFGERPDGSQLKFAAGVASDSLRGGRGTFVPVPDLPVEKVTPDELAEYDSFAKKYTEQWGTMDPVVAAVQRQQLPDAALERVTLDVQAAPLSKRHIKLVSEWLGEPTDQRLAPIPGDVASFEAVMRGGTYFDGGEHHLFGALRDADPAMAMDPVSTLLKRIFASQLEGLQGYLGAWPNPGFLKLLAGPLSGGPTDPAGYARAITGLTRRQVGQFTLLSFHPEILAQISPQLRFVKADRPAQVWFHADDLAGSKIAPLLNSYGFRQARQVTQGNTRFLNMLSEQLHVPQSECLTTAESLLNATFAAPLGGSYELREYPGGLKTWVATSVADLPRNSKAPAEYQFPALNWLRGVDLDLVAQNGMLAAHAELIMPVESRAPVPQLPVLPFGGARPAPNDKPAKVVPKRPALPAPSDVKPGGRREF